MPGFGISCHSVKYLIHAPETITACDPILEIASFHPDASPLSKWRKKKLKNTKSNENQNDWF